MQRKFKIGDRVEALDDTISGVIIGLAGEVVTIRNEEGFELEYQAGELMVLPGQNEINVSNYEVARVKQEKEKPVRKPRVKKPRERQAKMEVDLHIHQLVPTERGLSKHDILNLQLETAKRKLEFAMEKRIQYLVFIHGVGEGILREELEYLFRKYDNLRYYDADYQKYGLGATEVYIYQNTGNS